MRLINLFGFKIMISISLQDVSLFHIKWISRVLGRRYVNVAFEKRVDAKSFSTYFDCIFCDGISACDVKFVYCNERCIYLGINKNTPESLITLVRQFPEYTPPYLIRENTKHNETNTPGH